MTVYAFNRKEGYLSGLLTTEDHEHSSTARLPRLGPEARPSAERDKCESLWIRASANCCKRKYNTAVFGLVA